MASKLKTMFRKKETKKEETLHEEVADVTPIEETQEESKEIQEVETSEVDFVDLRPKVEVVDVELDEDFVAAVSQHHEALPEGYTVNILLDSFPTVEVITFDTSIPNTQVHVQSLRAILVQNGNVYGNHKRYVGTQEELIAQLKSI